MHFKVGQKVKFDPFKHIHTYGYIRNSKEVEGVITEIHYDHKWFAVQYGEAPNIFRTSFKFHDLNEDFYFVR